MSNNLNTLFNDVPFISKHFTDNFKSVAYLTPSESMIVSNTSAKRQADFITGRYCAKRALDQLLPGPFEILKGAGNEPLWPIGVTGSISHSGKLAGAIVAQKTAIATIGIDIETIGGVKSDTWYLLFKDVERDLIESKPDVEFWATLLFSLKESFYKMQYPLTRLFVDFTDMQISESGEKLLFSCTNPNLNFPFALGNLEIRWTKSGDQLITLCYLPR